ncbi:MAG: Glutaryl-7-ACA acylase [Frankiales bacterium]|nr:Glutaryl-7-ACA acylase [Frankiales bacterium]
MTDRWFTLLARKVGLPAPVVPRVTCDRRIAIPLADGVRTLADHWKPVGITNPPLVLVRSPYGRKIMNVLIGRHLAHQGFQVIVQSSRGTEGSEGVFDRPFACEVEDGNATVDWLRQQDFYPGRFFTFGDSYLGWTQIALSQGAGADLAGMVLRVAPSSLYDMCWPSGTLHYKALLGWSLMAQRNPVLGVGNAIFGKRKEAPIERTGKTAPLGQTYRQVAPKPIGFWEDWLGHPEKDDPHWESTEIGGQLDGVTCPVLVQGGWYDLFLEDTLSQYVRLQDAELNIGPWTHADMLTKGVGVSFTDATAWLRDQAGLEARASHDRVRLVEINSGARVGLEDWPVPHEPLGITVTADGGGEFTYDPADPTPYVGGALNDATSGSKDNTELEARADVLTFTSDPISADLHLLGSPHVSLTFGSDRPDTAVFIRLCEVRADGTSFNHTDRLVRLSSADQSAAGRWDVDVELPPTCLKVPAGHRLRVQVSSGAYPRFARHPGTDHPPGTAKEFYVARQSVQQVCLQVPLRKQV